MPDNGGGKAIEQQPDKQNPDIQAIIPPAKPDDPSSAATQTVAQQEEKSDIQKIEDRVRRAEKWMIWLTAAIAFSGLCSAFVAILQWRVMSGQLGEMHGGSAQTDKIIAADERMATAVERVLAQAKVSLDATIAQNQMDQRAWVAIRGTRIVTLEARKPIRIDLDLFNAGRTFAVDVVYTGTIVSHHGPLDIAAYARFNRPPAHSSPSIAILVPNLNSTAPGFTDQSPNQATVNAIKDGSEYLYIFGEIHYKDVFRQQHFTRFCNWYVPAENAFHQCAQYNDAD